MISSISPLGCRQRSLLDGRAVAPRLVSSERNDPHADAPPDALNERLQQEVGEPLGRVLPSLRLLQFLPHPQDAARYASDGIGPYGSHLGNRGTAGLEEHLWGRIVEGIKLTDHPRRIPGVGADQRKHILIGFDKSLGEGAL